jgi:thymidylate synthase
MQPFVLPDLRNGYVDLVNHVLEHGVKASPRGYETREVRGATITINDTRRLLPYDVGRDLKPAIGYAEALLLCGGIQSPSLLTSVSPAFSRFMDGGGLAGAYGPRVRPQMEHAIKQLRADSDTRQAIVQVYNPHADQLPVRDVSCTLGFGFHVRDGDLHMHTTMRSQDVWLGAAYDLFMFGQLGHTVANVLGLRLATLTHHVYSLHIYARNFEAAAGLHYIDPDEPMQSAEPRGFGDPDTWHHSRASLKVDGYETYEEVRQRAVALYELQTPSDITWSELSYADVLGDYQRAISSANFSS